MSVIKDFWYYYNMVFAVAGLLASAGIILFIFLPYIFDRK